MEYHKISMSKVVQLTELFTKAKIYNELDWELQVANTTIGAQDSCSLLEEIFSILELVPPEQPSEEEISEVEAEGEPD